MCGNLKELWQEYHLSELLCTTLKKPKRKWVGKLETFLVYLVTGCALNRNWVGPCWGKTLWFTRAQEVHFLLLRSSLSLVHMHTWSWIIKSLKNHVLIRFLVLGYNCFHSRSWKISVPRIECQEVHFPLLCSSTLGFPYAYMTLHINKSSKIIC